MSRPLRVVTLIEALATIGATSYGQAALAALRQPTPEALARAILALPMPATGNEMLAERALHAYGRKDRADYKMYCRLLRNA